MTKKEELVSCKNWSRGLIRISRTADRNTAEDGGNDVEITLRKEKLVETAILRIPRSRRARFMFLIAGRRKVENPGEDSRRSLPTEMAVILARGKKGTTLR